jgi:predicted MFS family arabinose efflux permease
MPERAASPPATDNNALCKSFELDRAGAIQMDDSELRPQNPLYSGYLLFLCCLSYFLACLDRYVFSTIIPSLKAEFHLSDAALGLMSGLAFALTYSLLGVPMGILTDRHDRKRVLTACILLWSAMTAACGVAKTAWLLVISRLGVGAGEAGVTPASVSMITDLYPQKARARAIAFYPICGTLGAAAALPIGAHLASSFGWRSVFLALSVPGGVLATLIWLTFREPARTAGEQPAPEKPSLVTTLLHLLGRRDLLLLFAAAGLMSMLSSMIQWLPSFYERSYGSPLNDIGNRLGLVLAISGPAGMFAGGWLADRSAREGAGKITVLLAKLSIVQVVSCALMLLAPNAATSIALVGVWNLFTVSWVAPCFALSQSLVPSTMRGASIGLLNVFTNIIGYGLGPAIAGAISTAIGAQAGADSLRWSLVFLGCGFGLLPGLLFLAAGRPLMQRAAMHKTPAL